MINDWKLLEDIQILFLKKIVIFGANNVLKKNGLYFWLKEMGADVVCFCDSDPLKWSDTVDSKRVVSPDDLAENIMDSDTIIILASSYLVQMDEILTHVGIYSEYVFSREAVMYGLWKYLQNNKHKFRSSVTYAILNNGYVNVDNFEIPYRDYACFREFMHNRRLGNNPVIVCGWSDNEKLSLKEEISRYIPAVSVYQLENYLSDAIQNLYMPDEKVKMIVIISEPITMGLSLYFDFLFYNQRIQKIEKENFIDEIIWFVKRLNENNKGNICSCDLMKLVGIDVCEYPFEKERGYYIIQKDNIEILLLRRDKISRMENIIGDFLSLEKFYFKGDSVRERWCDSLYKQVREKVRFPAQYLDFCYKNMSYIEHFYTKSEIREFWIKWKNNI